MDTSEASRSSMRKPWTKPPTVGEAICWSAIVIAGAIVAAAAIVAWRFT